MARCLYRSVSKCFFTCLLLWTTTILKSVSTAENECTYKGDICKIDYQKCLAEKYFSDMEECDSSYMHYGPGRIYDTRKEIRFYITIDGDHREYYAENLTYRILHARLMEEKFTSIDDCCSVGEKETCILPPLNNQVTERQYVFVPLSEATDKYCFFPIYAHSGHVPWCHETPESDSVCKIFKDGKLIIRNTFEALSTDLGDYCFFEAPGEYIKANRTNTAKKNKYTFNVVGISYGEKDGEIRIGNETRSCEITKEIEKHLERHKRSANKGACFFIRTNFDNKWDASPICTIPLLKDPDPPEETTKWFNIGYVVASSLIVIFFTLLSLWFYKRYIKASFIKYPEAIEELRNIDALEDSERQNFIENNASKQLNLESVHPDLIVPIDLGENLDKRPENERKAHECLFIDAKIERKEDEKEILININKIGRRNDFKELGQDQISEYVKKDNEASAPCVGMNGPIRKKSDIDSGFSQHSIVSSPLSSPGSYAPVFLDDVAECACFTPGNDDTMDIVPENTYVVKTCLRKISEIDSGFPSGACSQRPLNKNYDGTMKPQLKNCPLPLPSGRERQEEVLTNAVVDLNCENYSRKDFLPFNSGQKSNNTENLSMSKKCDLDSQFFPDTRLRVSRSSLDNFPCAANDDSRTIDFVPTFKCFETTRGSSSSSGHGSMEEEALLRHCLKNTGNAGKNVNARVEVISLLSDSDGYTLK